MQRFHCHATAKLHCWEETHEWCHGCGCGHSLQNSSGPNDKSIQSPLPSQVIVDFPQFSIDEEKRMHEDLPITCVAITPTTDRCQKNCCSITTIPFRVCKAITVHKSQGITVGPGNIWEKLVITLPREDAKHKLSGAELVSFSRVTDFNHLAIADHNGKHNSIEYFHKIGKGAAQDRKNEFTMLLSQHSLTSVHIMKTKISALDTENNTFEGGCAFLLLWYRSNFNI